MALNVVWFVLIAVLFTGYFFLEGFDYGVGILLPFLGRNDQERRVMANAIGPVWDANEVWLIVAGGAMFAAFPQWYATLFSGFYLALFLLLVALIVRGVGIEFRSRDERPGWRQTWDWLFFFGSLVPAVVWGMAMTDLVQGLPIDGHMNYVGTFLDLFTPFSLVGGAVSGLLFTLHGALFLALKTGEPLAARAMGTARRLAPLAVLAVAVYILMGYMVVPVLHRLGPDPGSIPVLAALSLVAAWALTVQERPGWAFAANGVTIVLTTITLFLLLYPRVMVSSLNPAWSLTIYNAASNPYSLKVMSIVAITLVPVVLAYQAWTYWMFRKRVRLHDELHY
ncbi:MAG: cytochrome d ubiquinol oxidase subunit II [Firmicutes bacterium]|nr:cytochrome d ubiquinol oxidase subunit II [Bacillota bacterium]